MENGSHIASVIFQHYKNWQLIFSNLRRYNIAK